MEIKTDCVVAIHYTLTNADGAVIDSSDGRAPLKYLQGHGNIIRGLEQALLGKKVGDSLNVVIEAVDAYGERDEDLIQQVPRAAFQGIDDIEVGMQFHAQTPDGGAIPVKVVGVTDEFVTVDGNHELAGERLFFAVTIEEVREAAPEELDHGHVHDGHSHSH